MKHIPELSIYIFIGSANGLVIASGYDHRRSFSTFVVLNLMTKDSVVLPNYMKHQKRVEGALGFGYDSMTDDYKVVAIFHTKSSSNVYVYSLRTYNWRRLSDSPYNHSLISWDRRGVFVNGFVHWIARKASASVIVSFSLADETFSEVPSPSQYNNNGHGLRYYTCRLVALGDKLAIVSEGGLVWLMNEYGLKKSWTKIVVHGYNETTMIEPENLFATHDLTRIYYHEEGSFPNSGDFCRRLESTFVESLVSPKLDRAN
ncbi:F-box associated domain containing protein [Tanacetum coccineum]